MPSKILEQLFLKYSITCEDHHNYINLSHTSFLLLLLSMRFILLKNHS